jgi:flagellar protein FlaJ
MERAFSQLLFEMADAMRGGIDPAKAIVEISTTDTGVLKDRLRIAAKNIKAGRPFEEVMETLGASTKSDIVKRYTSLVTESAKVGGEVSIVLHRSAKDMDDIIRVRAEKRRQLSMQIFTIYLAFAVLAAILYMLIDLYPQLMKLDLSILFNFNLNAAVAEQGSDLNRMGVVDLKRRFFHLILINSLGSGMLIGKLMDGKIKYGLIHSLILILATAVFFYFLVL